MNTTAAPSPLLPPSSTGPNRLTALGFISGVAYSPKKGGRIVVHHPTPEGKQ